MSLVTVADTPQTTVPRVPARPPHTATSSNLGDRIFSGLTVLFATLILVALCLIVGVLLVQAWPEITHAGWSFVTSTTWDPIHNVYGAGPAILGTIYSSLLALLLAGPVGVLVAIFLGEVSPVRLRFPLGFLVELLAAVPSIVYGLWALFVLVPIVRTYIEPPLAAHFGTVPLFSGYPLGLGMLSAALILAVMILPTIAAISRDVILVVPRSQREAMMALGATRWEVIWKVVVPYARSGIVGGIILGLGRAVGETMAVQMVIGNTQGFSLSLFDQATTMPATIVNQFTEATGTLYRSALLEMALFLMIITLALNALARLLVWSMTRRFGQ